MQLRIELSKIALAVACFSFIVGTARANGEAQPEQLATGQFVTPGALKGAVQEYLNPGLAQYPNFVAGEAVRSQISPDGTTLAIITAGQNSLFRPDGKVDSAASTQFIFLYDVSGRNRSRPKLKQVLQQGNAHVGLVFSPDGKTLYTAGGVDDVIYVYKKLRNSVWEASGNIPLGHKNAGVGIDVRPNASGLDISSNGKILVVANNYNDSISVIDTQSQKVRYEHDLRPYFANNEGVDGGVGGTFPFAVAIKGNSTAYVSSERDREIVVVDISKVNEGRLVKRIKLDGNPLGLRLDKSGATLYAAQDNADQVAVIDTVSDTVTTKIDARGPSELMGGSKYTGVATFSVALARNGRVLYAVNAGANSIAVIPLTGSRARTVTGLIPTAYEPHDLTFSADGKWMYVINGKSNTGPNSGHLAGSTARIENTTYAGGNAAAAAASKAANQYGFQMERASLLAAPVPTASDLPRLTQQVATNNFYATPTSQDDVKVMQFLRQRIKHIIYVVKENRTFDQVLGDLTNGANSDPKLTQWGKAITPNYHKLATSFVTLDNFMAPGDGSMDGWSWAMQGRVTNAEAITQQVSYAAVSRGLSYESEGTNRGVPVNFAMVLQREVVSGLPGSTSYANATAGILGGTVNVLAGVGNHASADAPFGIQNGYIFNAVLTAGGSVRNYGFLVNNVGNIGTKEAPISNPFASDSVQVTSLSPELTALTDAYYRGYDQNYPDLWRYNEWKREFDQYVSNGRLPSLSLVRISHDHTGDFATALAGVNTPDTQQADCDLATGRIVEAVANSPYADNTLVIILEDDVQDGPDHVDSHRSPVFVVGPYVKQGTVIGTRYSQVNALRTIEDILWTDHINLNTASQRPMADVFDITSSGKWTYTAEISSVLATTSLDLAQGDQPIKFATGPMVKPRHDVAYWSEKSAGLNFEDADAVPAAKYNRILWAGTMGKRLYPTIRGHSSSQKDED